MKESENRGKEFLFLKINPKNSMKLKPASEKTLIFTGWWLLFFALSILVRLPHYLSKNFFFDGDEAVIGIMAQELLRGKSFPFYFAGQNYGLSTFEVFSTALFIKILGSTVWALRLGGLLLFSLGTTFIFKTAQNRNVGLTWSFLITLVVLCFPSWYLWGGMVRGGYVTTFTLCCASFYIIHGLQFSMRNLVIVSILSALAYESHVLILVPFASFILFWILKQDKPIWKGVLLTVVFAASVILIRLVGHTDAQWPDYEMVFGVKKQMEFFAMQTEGALAGYSNFFFFSKIFEIPLWWQILLYVSLSLITFTICWDFVKSSKFRKFYYLFFLLSLATFCFLLSTVDSPVPRYWIGFFTGLMFVVIFIFITRVTSLVSKGMIILLAVILVAGTGSGSKIKGQWTDADVNEMKAFEGLYKEVKKYKPKAIFISDNLIQYQWNYLYGKEIPASAFRDGERINEFNDKVIEIYKKEPSRAVIAGLWGISLYMDTIDGFNRDRYQVEEKYYINPNAAPEYVKQGREKMRKK